MMAGDLDDLDPGLSDDAMGLLVEKFQQSFGMVLAAAFKPTLDRDLCSPEQADNVQRAAMLALVLTLIVHCELHRRPEIGPLNQCVLELVTEILEQYGDEIQQKIKDLNEGVGESFH